MRGGLPERGDVLLDAAGRELTVEAVAPGDRLGREVRGRVVDPDGGEAPYATSLSIFVPVWAERKPERVIL